MRWRDTQISRFLGFCGKKCTHRGCEILQYALKSRYNEPRYSEFRNIVNKTLHFNSELFYSEQKGYDKIVRYIEV